MADTQTPDRGARRRARTRAKLLAAARTLFAEKGVEATRINEITEEADVGFGSFYNHFESKDEIVEALLDEMVSSEGERIDEATRELDDPAEIVAVAHRTFMRHAAEDPEWGWLILRLDITHGVLSRALGPFAARDMQAGIDAGRFHVADPVLSLNVWGGALLAAMRAVIVEDVGPDADVHHAEGILRALGLPLDEAAEVARRPLPVTAPASGPRAPS